MVVKFLPSRQVSVPHQARYSSFPRPPPLWLGEGGQNIMVGLPLTLSSHTLPVIFTITTKYQAIKRCSYNKDINLILRS